MVAFNSFFFFDDFSKAICVAVRVDETKRGMRLGVKLNDLSLEKLLDVYPRVI